MSSYYLDILKDRLYAYKADSIERRSAQTAMYEIMVDLVVMLAPVLSFTMEEVWQFMKKTSDMPESVLMMPWPEVKEEYIDPALEKKWEDELYAEGEALAVLKSVEKDLPALLIVSQAELHEGVGEAGEATTREDLKVAVKAAEGHKCERCWIYSDTVGQDAEHPTLCARCAPFTYKNR